VIFRCGDGIFICGALIVLNIWTTLRLLKWRWTVCVQTARQIIDFLQRRGARQVEKVTPAVIFIGFQGDAPNFYDNLVVSIEKVCDLFVEERFFVNATWRSKSKMEEQIKVA
jgi:hypothetical protein